MHKLLFLPLGFSNRIVTVRIPLLARVAAQGGEYLSAANKVPLWEKLLLTLDEASALSGIGKNTLRRISDDDNCQFVMFVGNKRLIKRQQFDAYLASVYSI